MSTIFIAVQCFQCSTMQVKQKKKSSNKWVCVVCNEKQSVRKIFARGFLAKDVRKFVQGFNMSRQFDAETPSIQSQTPKNQEIPTQELFHTKRSDWTEYLGEEEENGERAFSEPEVEIVTEFPKEMFKKSRREGSKQLFKPVFSKRKERPADPLGDMEPEKDMRKKAKQMSKWSDYLEVENDGLVERGRGTPNHHNSWGEGVLQSHYSDHRVEEDIHPDFI